MPVGRQKVVIVIGIEPRTELKLFEIVLAQYVSRFGFGQMQGRKQNCEKKSDHRDDDEQLD
jgi:hypothetical protein